MKGRKFIVDGKEIAVFKVGDKFHAVSNLCCHQKGPLYKGKVSCGTIQCPWHYKVFDLKNGNYLGNNSNFKLETVETHISEDFVYVSVDPKKKID